jgi:hypothetical protein
MITASLFAFVASRFFVEARRTGELELLLTTPVGAKEIVSTQWAVVKRLLNGPVLLMLIAVVVRSLMTSSHFVHNDIYFNMISVFAAADMVVGVGALCWLGLLFGFRGNQGRAILSSVLLAKGLPYVLWWVWTLFDYVVLWPRVYRASWFYSLGYLLSQVIVLLYLLWLIRMARRRLQREVAGIGPLTLRQSFFDTVPRWSAVLRSVRSWPPTDSPE